MAARKSVKRPRTATQDLSSLTKLVREGFRRTDAKFTLMSHEFSAVHKEIQRLDERIDKLATHVDGFVKLHETLDIELRVMKEQMNRFEDRLIRLESARTSS